MYPIIFSCGAVWKSPHFLKLILHSVFGSYLNLFFAYPIMRSFMFILSLLVNISVLYYIQVIFSFHPTEKFERWPYNCRFGGLPSDGHGLLRSTRGAHVNDISQETFAALPQWQVCLTHNSMWDVSTKLPFLYSLVLEISTRIEPNCWNVFDDNIWNSSSQY